MRKGWASFREFLGAIASYHAPESALISNPPDASLMIFPLLAGLFVLGSGCHKNKPPPPPAPEVMVVTVQPKDVPVYKEWIGSLDGLVNAQIRAQVSGYLLS